MISKPHRQTAKLRSRGFTATPNPLPCASMERSQKSSPEVPVTGNPTKFRKWIGKCVLGCHKCETKKLMRSLPFCALDQRGGNLSYSQSSMKGKTASNTHNAWNQMYVVLLLQSDQNNFLGRRVDNHLEVSALNVMDIDIEIDPERWRCAPGSFPILVNLSTFCDTLWHSFFHRKFYESPQFTKPEFQNKGCTKFSHVLFRKKDTVCLFQCTFGRLSFPAAGSHYQLCPRPKQWKTVDSGELSPNLNSKAYSKSWQREMLCLSLRKKHHDILTYHKSKMRKLKQQQLRHRGNTHTHTKNNDTKDNGKSA